MGGSADVAPLGLQLCRAGSAARRQHRSGMRRLNILPMSILFSNDAIARSGIADSMSTDEKVRRMKGLRI